MPTPRVSVPQMTFSRPAWASCSTSRRYLGSIPAWWTPIPCRTSRDSVRPNPAVKRKPPIGSAIASRSARGCRRLTLDQRLGPLERRGLGEVHDVEGRLARSRAAPRASRAAASARSRRCSGTGRSADRDHRGRPAGAPGQVLARSRRRRRAWPTSARTGRRGSSSSGTCHAQPRSGSA